MSLQSTRPAAVAGMFYPGEPRALAGEVDAMLSTVPPAPTFAALT